MDPYSLGEITKRLDAIIEQQKRLILMGAKVMDHLERLEKSVSNIDTVGGSIEAALHGIAAELRNLKDNGAAEIAAFADRLDARAESMKTAVFEHTEVEDDTTDPTDPTDPVDPDPTEPENQPRRF